MPSKSSSQQKLFGWALACKRKETDNCPSKVAKLADSMSESELEKYASTPNINLPEHLEESFFECIEDMSIEEFQYIDCEDDSIDEKVSTDSKKDTPISLSDVPVTKDVKTPPQVDHTPDPPPGYVHSDKRKDPGFFTPSLFKRPGDKKAKSERRIMDFNEFLKRINYKTHDSVLQTGSGKNL